MQWIQNGIEITYTWKVNSNDDPITKKSFFFRLYILRFCASKRILYIKHIVYKRLYEIGVYGKTSTLRLLKHIDLIPVQASEMEFDLLLFLFSVSQIVSAVLCVVVLTSSPTRILSCFLFLSFHRVHLSAYRICREKKVRKRFAIFTQFVFIFLFNSALLLLVVMMVTLLPNLMSIDSLLSEKSTIVVYGTFCPLMPCYPFRLYMYKNTSFIYGQNKLIFKAIDKLSFIQ